MWIHVEIFGNLIFLYHLKLGTHFRTFYILKDIKIFFGYVIEIVSKNREGPFYVNLTQVDVDNYLLPGEIKIYKGVGKNKKFVSQRVAV